MLRILCTALFSFLLSTACSARAILINDINGNLSITDRERLLTVVRKDIEFQERYIHIPDSLTIDIRLFKKKQEFLKYKDQTSGEAGKRASDIGYYSYRRNEVVLWKVSYYLSVLYHEAQHAVIASGLKNNAPVWLNEGLSHYYADVKFEKEQLVIKLPNVVHKRIRKWIDRDTLPAWEKFFSLNRRQWKSVNKQGKDKISSTLSWSIVYFLMNSRDGHDALGVTLARIQQQGRKLSDLVYPGGLDAFDRDYRQFYMSPAVQQQI